MNAIVPIQPPEAADRTARHLRQCAELADLAMQLARAAAARTLADWAEPAAPSPVEPPLTETAQPGADRQTAPPPKPRDAAAYRPTDPAVLFTRLAAVVRDCIALEARLSAGATDAPQARVARADPRRARLREVLGAAIGHHPGRAELLREATTRLDEHLAGDPDQTSAPGHFLIAICETLGINLDLAKVPDDCLFAPKNPPNPRATSPP